MSDETPDQRKRRLRILIAVAVLVGAIVLLIVTEYASVPDATPTPNSSKTTVDKRAIITADAASAGSTTGKTVATIEPGPTPVRAFGATASAPPAANEEELCEAALSLNRPDRSARDDVSAVAELVASFVQQFHEVPVGNNAEITAALAGDNSRGYAGIRADNPAISAQGELTDRWGTPYFFHTLASDRMEIRCAGADRRMFTHDDIVWPQADAIVAQATP